MKERNMKKRMSKLVSILLTGTMALSMVGCGSANTTTAPEQTATDAVAETTDQETEVASVEAGADAEESKEPVTIKITWWGGQGRHDYTQQLLDLYTELHPNVTFEAMPAGWDGYFDKLSTQAAAGSMPDIVQMDYLYISTYANNNTVADLQQFIDDGTIDVSNVDEKILKTGRINEKLEGIVLSTSVMSVGYNPDVLAEAGVSEPTPDWTWSDFTEMCQTVTEKTGKFGAALSPVGDTNHFHYWVRQHGEKLFSDDNKALGYTDDAILASYLSMWKDLMDQGVAPNPDEWAQIETLGQEAGPVVTGDGAMIFEWNNYANKVVGVNDKIKMVTMPMADDSDNKGLWLKPGMFFSVAETSNVKKEAAEFINWFINSEEANDIIMGERGTPVSSAIREYMSAAGNMSAQQDEMFAIIDAAAELSGETPAPDPIGMSEVNEVFKNAAYKVFYGQASPQEAASAFREEANAILSRSN